RPSIVSRTASGRCDSTLPTTAQCDDGAAGLPGGGVNGTNRSMVRTIAVANQKGGVAKTTTVAALGAALGERGRRAPVVDLDPQACLTFSLGFDPDELQPSIHDVFVGRCGIDTTVLPVEDEAFELVPANIDLAGAEMYLLTRTGREYALRSALEEIGDG